jgi:hypothetical protein
MDPDEPTSQTISKPVAFGEKEASAHVSLYKLDSPMPQQMEPSTKAASCPLINDNQRECAAHPASNERELGYGTRVSSALCCAGACATFSDGNCLECAACMSELADLGELCCTCIQCCFAVVLVGTYQVHHSLCKCSSRLD